MHILIEKSARRLTLMDESGAILLSCPVALGREPAGHKLREGDNRTPEGEYYVCTRNERSKYHLALGLSYPAPKDAEAAFLRGEITTEQTEAIRAAHTENRRPPWDTPLGGFIMIHGGGIEGDWTKGCIALTNEQMDELFPLCPLCTRVRILP